MADFAYAYQNPNSEILRRSSSGGFFTRLAESVIERGGVVFGARFDGDWKVVVDYCESVDALEAFRGSKYVQARVGNAYQDCEDFLKLGRTVLFTGTPCMIAGLKSFLKREYANLVTMDFICHGTPKKIVWEAYLKSLRKRPSRISFRNKSNGWKSYVCDAGIRLPFWEHPYMQVFLSDIALRDCCYSCQYKNWNSGSDVTVGDFWGIEHICPDIDDDRGLCVVVPHSAKVAEFVPEFGSFRKFPLEDLLVFNPSALTSAARPRLSRLFLALIERGCCFNIAYKICLDRGIFWRGIRFLWHRTIARKG